MCKYKRTSTLHIFLLYLSLRMRKPKIAYAKTTTQISCAVTAQLISAFVVAKRIVLFLFYIYQKFLASSFMLSLYSLVSVGPCRKPKSLDVSYTGSFSVSSLPHNGSVCSGMSVLTFLFHQSLRFIYGRIRLVMKPGWDFFVCSECY